MIFRGKRILIFILVMAIQISLVLNASNSAAVTNSDKKFISVDAGYGHAIALTSDGSVWTSGKNEYGELGIGDRGYRAGFVKVSSISGIKAIAAGESHCVALKSDGTVWTWGYNSDGQIGDNSNDDKLKPVKVQSLNNVIAIAAGYKHTLALKKDGTLWAWGYNYYGSIGDGTKVNKLSPVKVLDNVKSIIADHDDNLAIKNDNSIWVWGCYVSDVFKNWSVKDRIKPIMLKGITNYSKIELGAYNDFMIGKDGSLWSWKLDLEKYSKSKMKDTKIDAVITKFNGINKVKDASFSYGNNLILKNDGTVWNIKEDISKFEDPFKIENLENIIKVVSYYGCFFAIKSDGTLWAWGNNFCGELGDGTSKGSTKPGKISVKSKFTNIFANSSCTFSLEEGTGVWGWGAIPILTDNNKYISIPKKIEFNEEIVNVSVELGKVVILTKTNEVFESYRNYVDELDFIELGLEDVSMIRSGTFHTVALKKDGTVWAWGWNSSGQLGNGTFEDNSDPVKINGLSNVIAIAASASTSYALKKDGTVWAWGVNNFMELNENTEYYISKPTKIPGLSNITAISAGDETFAALNKDGTVWELANIFDSENYISERTPRKVTELKGIISLAVGRGHFLALDKDLCVWAWGLNSDGQLGNDSFKINMKPTKVSGLSKIVKITAGDDHSVALSEAGEIWTWGDDMFGQLGIGKVTHINEPIQISIPQ